MSGRSKKDTPPAPEQYAPNVAGNWSGTWESIKKSGNGGTVNCDAVQKIREQKWSAVILAEYGRK